MVRAMSLSSDVRTQHALGWISIIWFASALSIADSEGVELQITPVVVAQCGKNVTLTCNASSSRPMKILLFSWLANTKIVCQSEHDPTDRDVLCESTTKTSHHRLTLTLINVMPVNNGKYFCKLRSNVDVKTALTFVTVQDCLGGGSLIGNASNARCSFTGVYPRGTIHWFHGDVNITDSASTQEEKDQDGRYNVTSVLYVGKRNPSLPYNCSLWIPSEGKYRSSQSITIPSSLKSSGDMVKLQWICVLVGFVMVKFMT